MKIRQEIKESGLAHGNMEQGLRDYQVDSVRKIFEAWDPQRLNHKNVLLQMPTGTGKTTVFSAIVEKAQQKNKNVLLVVHRKELVDQIASRLEIFNVNVGIISADTPSQPHKAIQVATIQTLSRRSYPPADIVIIDECHHSTADTYKKLWDIYPDARFLGVTATPIRLNGEGFEKLFNILISIGTLSFFIKEGYLSKVKHTVCRTPDLTGVKIKMRDYDTQMLKNIMLNNSQMANLVESYKKLVNGKKAIVFAVDVEHSKCIAKRYQDAGITSAHVDGETPKREREQILDKFRKGEILVLCNVEIVSEGFDVPDCEVVQLARPTKSLALYLQQVGRCMRPVPGKEYGYVLDNAGLWLEHSLSYIDRDWCLEGIKKSKRSGIIKEKIIAVDEEGVIREINHPVEADDLELVEVSPELERLLIFESFVRIAKKNDHKLISAVYRYSDYLISKRLNFTDIEVNYCHKRLNNEGANLKKGFWYHRKLEIEETIKSLNHSIIN